MITYGVRWQINFVALHSGDKYRVEILEGGYNGSITRLLGAANPFETSEDNTDDAFTPIRKQTGSLRIADNGKDLDGNTFDYTELLPTDTFDFQVRLWKEGTTDVLRWIGYIRPDSLTSRMFEMVSIREYKLTCPLGVLYEIPVTFTNTKIDMGTVKSMGQILYTALNSLNVAWNKVLKQDNVTNLNDLKSKVSLLNFISNNKPTHGTLSDVDTFTATWTDDTTSWGAVLEDVCKFWGWTLYSRALDLYIVARNQRDQFKSMAFSQLPNSNPIPDQDPDIEYVNFEDLDYASTNHTECRRLGYKNVTVESNVNDKEVVLDPDYNNADMSYWLVNNNPGQIVHKSNNYLYMLRRLGAEDSQATMIEQFFDNYQIRENRLLQTSMAVPFVLCTHDSWDSEAFRTATALNMKKGICCYTNMGPNPVRTYNLIIKTLEDIAVPLNSVLCISASVDISYNPDPDASSCGEDSLLDQDANTAPPAEWQPHTADPDEEYYKPILEDRKVFVTLQVGEKYWDYDNGQWTTQQKFIPLTFHKDGSIVDPVNQWEAGGFVPTGILFDNHNGSKGLCIYMTVSANNGDGICGRMKLMVYDNIITFEDHIGRLNNGILNDLSVSIYNTDSKFDPKNKASHEFKGVASARFHNDLSVSLKMASGSNNLYGLGQIFNANFSLLTTLSFINEGGGTILKQPEQRLLERMTEFYRNVSVQNTIEVLDDPLAELPSTVIVKDGGEQYHTQNVTHDWHNGKMKITIINN